MAWWSDGRLVIVDATPDPEAVVSGRFDLGGLLSRIAHALAQVQGKRLVLDPIDALLAGFSGRGRGATGVRGDGAPVAAVGRDDVVGG